MAETAVTVTSFEGCICFCIGEGERHVFVGTEVFGHNPRAHSLILPVSHRLLAAAVKFVAEEVAVSADTTIKIMLRGVANQRAQQLRIPVSRFARVIKENHSHPQSEEGGQGKSQRVSLDQCVRHAST